MKNKKIISFFSFILALVFALSGFSVTVFANSIVPEDIDKTDVMTDLKKMEAFNSSRYTVDETVDYCEIIELIEYGYSYEGSTVDYGLYLYIYNPSCKDIIYADSKSNRVQIRIAEVDEEIAGGDTPWRKYSMKHISHTSDNLFFKFKIEVPNNFMLEVNKDRRVYEIADVELLFSGETMSRSVGTSGKWIYSGYQEYHGVKSANETSSLSWNPTNLLTIELDLNAASWKTNTSSKGVGYQHELSSVYFSVPDKIIEDYGDPDDVYKGLREVDGVYENYKITGISTADDTFYETVDKVAHLNCNYEDISFGFMSELCYVAEPSNVKGPYTSYNMASFPLQTSAYSMLYDRELTRIGNAFKGTADGITNEEFETQIRSKYATGTLGAYSGSYPINEFNIKTDSSEEGDIANKFTSYAKEYGENWLFYFFTGNPIYQDEVYDEIEPIVAIDESKLATLTAVAFGEDYFVGESDSSDFYDYVKANASGNTTYLMRFAVTDYYCSDIYVAQEGSGNDIAYGSGNYYFEKEVFLNFDILSLTWENKNGVRTVIPVQATPIDVTGDVTPTPDNDGGGLPGILGGIGEFFEDAGDTFNWLKSLKPIFLIIAIILVMVVIFSIPGLGNFLGKAISLPFRLVGNLFGFVNDNLDRREARKESKERRKNSKQDRMDRKSEREESHMRWESERADRKAERKDKREMWEAERSDRDVKRTESNFKWFVGNYDNLERVDKKQREKFARERVRRDMEADNKRNRVKKLSGGEKKE